MTPPDDVIERFLATGELEHGYPGWPGRPAERRRAAEAAVRDVLARIVRWRARHAPLSVGALPDDPARVTRERAGPMVRGLLGAEAGPVLEWLPSTVRILTPDTYPALIATLPPRTAWDLANVLLDAIGAPPLADDTPELEGLAGAGCCHVLPDTFRAPGALDDVLVHELAHVLHDARRGAAGLSPPDAPVLHVHPHNHETFAWACELWSAISREPEGILARLHAWEAGAPPEDARVDLPRLRSTLRAAADGADWAALRPLLAPTN